MITPREERNEYLAAVTQAFADMQSSPSLSREDAWLLAGLRASDVVLGRQGCHPCRVGYAPTALAA
jgi:hypothetical protein